MLPCTLNFRILSLVLFVANGLMMTICKADFVLVLHACEIRCVVTS